MTMPKSQKEEATAAARGIDGAVSSIVSRLIAKGGCLLGTDALRRLRDLEPAAAEREELIAVHDALGAAAALRPERSRLELPLQAVKPMLSRAEEVLDKVVESHEQILSLPEGTNPFFQRSIGKKLQSAVSGVFHAHRTTATPDMRSLKERVHKVESLIDKAEMELSNYSRPGMKGVGRHPPPKVIGRDAECRDIVAALHGTRHGDEEEVAEYSSGGRPYSVMGIHGAAGSGKTTLAQSIYARASAQEGGNRVFDLFMWVQLCRHFTPQEVVNEMMMEAVGRSAMMKAAKGRGDDCDIAPLLSRLQDEMRGKRLLLVLDDVRCDGNGPDLKQILSPLLDVVKAGSKVLITARSVDALLLLGAERSGCVPIRELDDDVFLRLFMHYALGDDGVDDRDRGILEVIGADIAAKLKRSPLVAKLVGKELRATPQIEFWRNIRDTI